jgi:hypothetical protein
MPNECNNTMTITCHEDAEELTRLVTNELQICKFGRYFYKETIRMNKRGRRGIHFNMVTAWEPDYEWLEELLDKYPKCWVKNEWWEEGGFAGVWVGCIRNGEKIIRQMNWVDICIEGTEFLFMDEAEETAWNERFNRRSRNIEGV